MLTGGTPVGTGQPTMSSAMPFPASSPSPSASRSWAGPMFAVHADHGDKADAEMLRALWHGAKQISDAHTENRMQLRQMRDETGL